MRVAVLDDYHRIAHTLADWASLGVEVAFFDRPLAREQISRALAGFDTLVLMRERTAFPRELLEQLPNLSWSSPPGCATPRSTSGTWHERGVRVCGTGIPGYGASQRRGRSPGVPSTVEVAWALIFALFKRVTDEDRAIRAGIWQQGLPRQPRRLARSGCSGSAASAARWSRRPGPSAWR